MAAPIISGIGQIGTGAMGLLGSAPSLFGAGGGAGAVSGIAEGLAGGGQLAPALSLPNVGKQLWDIANPANWAAGAAGGAAPTSGSPMGVAGMTGATRQPSMMRDLAMYGGQRLIDRALTPSPGGGPVTASLAPMDGSMSAPSLSFGAPNMGGIGLENYYPNARRAIY